MFWPKNNGLDWFPKFDKFLKITYLRRIQTAILSNIYSLVLPVFNILFSIFIIKRFSAEMWGEFVQFYIIVNLLSHFTAWGNRDFLLKEFSAQPGKIALYWQTSLASRFNLVWLSLPVVFLLNFSLHIKLILFLWVLSQFLFRSFDVIIVYTKKFGFPLLVDVLGYLILFGMVFVLGKSFDAVGILTLFSTVTLTKSILLSFFFRKEFLASLSLKIRLDYLRNSFGFFLPGFIGLVQSKMDMYCVAFLLPEIMLGKYQVFMNLLVLVHSIAVFSITPFLKVIYRLNAQSVKKLENLLISLGVFYSAGLLFLAYLILNIHLDFSFSISMYFIAYLLLLPYFLYFIKMHQLFRYNRQMIVVWITFITAILNLALSIILIPKIGLEGALISGTIVQWANLGGFLYVERFRSSKETGNAQIKNQF